MFGRGAAGPRELRAGLLAERVGERDIAYHVPEPQVLIALAPQDLFLDPSHTYRLDLAALAAPASGDITVRDGDPGDQADIDRIYAHRRMVPLRAGFLARRAVDTGVSVLVATRRDDARVIGVVMGIDHVVAFDDPDNGSSLWSLAVDADAMSPGVGRELVTALAERLRTVGRDFMDLSVLHDNHEAVRLYEGLGFRRVDLYCVKKKNPINEPLFIAPQPAGDALNVYAEIIVTEARRRGIRVDVLDAASGLFELSHGGVPSPAVSRCAI